VAPAVKDSSPAYSSDITDRRVPLSFDCAVADIHGSIVRFYFEGRVCRSDNRSEPDSKPGKRLSANRALLSAGGWFLGVRVLPSLRHPQIAVPMHKIEGVSNVYIVRTCAQKRGFCADQQFLCNRL